MYRIDARRSNDLFAKRCLQMAFVRGSETPEQISDGSGRGLFKTTVYWAVVFLVRFLEKLVKLSCLNLTDS